MSDSENILIALLKRMMNNQISTKECLQLVEITKEMSDNELKTVLSHIWDTYKSNKKMGSEDRSEVFNQISSDIVQARQVKSKDVLLITLKRIYLGTVTLLLSIFIITQLGYVITQDDLSGEFIVYPYAGKKSCVYMPKEKV